MRILRWLAEEAWEKINVVETWRELKALGQRYGRRFFIAAFLWELVEDVLFPILAYKAGYPVLIPVFLVLHFEPVVYPIFFFAFRTWDRFRGFEPWEPDRNAQSAVWRSGAQVLTYRIPAMLVFFALLSKLDVDMVIFTVYTLGMSFFGFVHDRLWHDSNFGIDVPTDTVQPKRVLAKVATYRAVSFLVMSGVFYGLLGHLPPEVLIYQGVMTLWHLMVTAWWAHSPLGIHPIQTRES